MEQERQRKERERREYALANESAEESMARAEREGKRMFDKPDSQKAAASKARAQRRAKNAIRDLALSNEFRYFVTLTLDRTKINRYDVGAVTKALNRWLDHRVRRDGLAYVLVAERHKDGAIHFHGFFNAAIDARDSGTVIPPTGGKPKRPRGENQRLEWLQNGGHIVYNLPAWDFGFTTAIELYGDYRAAVGYVCKYISKDSEKVGGRWYYHGGALRKPTVELLDVDAEALEKLDGARTFAGAGLPGVRFTYNFIDSDKENGVNNCETDTVMGELRQIWESSEIRIGHGTPEGLSAGRVEYPGGGD